MSLLIKTYQDAIRQVKNVLTVLGMDFFMIHLEERNYYGDVIAIFTENDTEETEAHPGDHIKVRTSLCDMGTIDTDLRSSEFFDRYLNFLFTICEGPPT